MYVVLLKGTSLGRIFYQDKFTNTLNEIGHVIGDDKKLGCLYFFLLLLSPITVNVSQVKQVLHALMDLSTGIIIYLGMISRVRKPRYQPRGCG